MCVYAVINLMTRDERLTVFLLGMKEREFVDLKAIENSVGCNRIRCSMRGFNL